MLPHTRGWRVVCVEGRWWLAALFCLTSTQCRLSSQRSALLSGRTRPAAAACSLCEHMLGFGWVDACGRRLVPRQQHPLAGYLGRLQASAVGGPGLVSSSPAALQVCALCSTGALAPVNRCFGAGEPPVPAALQMCALGSTGAKGLAVPRHFPCGRVAAERWPGFKMCDARHVACVWGGCVVCG